MTADHEADGEHLSVLLDYDSKHQTGRLIVGWQSPQRLVFTQVKVNPLLTFSPPNSPRMIDLRALNVLRTISELFVPKGLSLDMVPPQ